MTATPRQAPTYEPSPKHCEPITAERPGSKCPAWSAAVAQELLDASELIGGKRFATRDGVAFVGQMTRLGNAGEIWHGYPEAWDRIPVALKLTTRADVIAAFGGKA